MAILHIYDDNGNQINIPAIKGNTGPQGLQGIQGKSAYDVAVENGFKGTETQWLASLKGETGNPTTFGIISSSNTTMPVSGADIASAIALGEVAPTNTTHSASGSAIAAAINDAKTELNTNINTAIANAAPNFTPENYIEITEETNNNVTSHKLRTTIGNESTIKEMIYDLPIADVNTDSAPNVYINTIPVAESPKNFLTDQINIHCLEPDTFETEFQNFLTYDATETTSFTVVNTNPANEAYLNTLTASGTGSYPNNNLFLIKNNSTTYTLTKSSIEREDIVAAYFYNIQSENEAIALIDGAKANSLDSTLTLTKSNTSDPAFYLVIFNDSGFVNTVILSDEDMSQYASLSSSNFYTNIEYYITYNTETTFHDVANTPSNLIKINPDDIALVAQFLDDSTLQIISTANLLNEKIQIELLKTDTVKWKADQIAFGPHLTKYQNKIDFPYGTNLIYKDIKEKINLTTFNTIVNDSTNPSMNEYEATISTSISNLNITTPTAGDIINIKISSNWFKDFIITAKWVTSVQNQNKLCLLYNAQEHNSGTYTFFNSLLLPTLMVEYSPELSENIQIRVRSKLGAFTSCKVEFFDWKYGIKTIPNELLEDAFIATLTQKTITSTDPSTGEPTTTKTYKCDKNIKDIIAAIVAKKDVKIYFTSDETPVAYAPLIIGSCSPSINFIMLMHFLPDDSPIQIQITRFMGIGGTSDSWSAQPFTLVGATS